MSLNCLKGHSSKIKGAIEVQPIFDDELKPKLRTINDPEMLEESWRLFDENTYVNSQTPVSYQLHAIFFVLFFEMAEE